MISWQKSLASECAGFDSGTDRFLELQFANQLTVVCWRMRILARAVIYFCLCSCWRYCALISIHQPGRRRVGRLRSGNSNQQLFSGNQSSDISSGFSLSIRTEPIGPKG